MCYGITDGVVIERFGGVARIPLMVQLFVSLNGDRCLPALQFACECGSTFCRSKRYSMSMTADWDTFLNGIIKQNSQIASRLLIPTQVQTIPATWSWNKSRTKGERQWVEGEEYEGLSRMPHLVVVVVWNLQFPSYFRATRPLSKWQKEASFASFPLPSVRNASRNQMAVKMQKKPLFPPHPDSPLKVDCHLDLPLLTSLSR